MALVLKAYQDEASWQQDPILAGNITLFPPSKDTLTTVIVFIITLTVGHVTGYLHDGDDAGDHHHEVGRLPVVAQTARDDAEGGVPEHAQRGHLQHNETLRFV